MNIYIYTMECHKLVVSSVFMFTPMPGDMIQFDQDFSNGLKPPTRNCFDLFFFGRMLLKTLQLWNGKWKLLEQSRSFASKRGMIYIGGLFINLNIYHIKLSRLPRVDLMNIFVNKALHSACCVVAGVYMYLLAKDQ